MIKIYFAGSIRAGRDDVELYKKIISKLQEKHKVLTEHIGEASLGSFGETGLSNIEIHNRDMNWVLESDLIVAEVTNPSLGVGYEIGRALEHNKKIICLYRQQEGKRLSAMISGCDKLKVFEYQSIEDLKELFNKI